MVHAASTAPTVTQLARLPVIERRSSLSFS
jgi:hypothetical protein